MADFYTYVVLPRRNEEGLTKKQQELMDLKTRVDDLKSKGLSLRAIAKELNITL